LSYNYHRGRSIFSAYPNTVFGHARSNSVTIGLVSIVKFTHLKSVPFSLTTIGDCPVIRPARIIQPSDLLHLRVGGYVLSPKQDGLKHLAQLANGVITFGGASYPCLSYSHAATVQLEEMDDRYYLVDIQFSHWRNVPFPHRYTFLTVLASLLTLPKPVYVNDFFIPMSTADLFYFFLKVRSMEGFLVGNFTAYCPSGFSDFVYVKQMPTVDLMVDGKIQEFHLTRTGTSFFRDRPDKTLANPLTQLLHTHEAPSYDLVQRVMLQHACDVPLSGLLEEVLKLSDIANCTPAAIARLVLAAHLIPTSKYWELTGLLQTLHHDQFKNQLVWAETDL